MKEYLLNIIIILMYTGLTRDVATTQYTQHLGAAVRSEEPARLRRAHGHPGAGVSSTPSLGIV
jgi:hypothetical protein|tara:strand:- start:4155 stop:4343 length:189 start_codon:yes stop_codon:yes gene_type:complete